MRRTTRLVLAALATLCAACPALAQGDYPSRTVRIIVGFVPSSSTDIVSRLMANQWTRLLGQQFVVENRPGAASAIAADLVARAPKDGYTLLAGGTVNLSTGLINPQQSFDIVRDFTPVFMAAGQPMILTVHPSLGVASVAELIALAKSKPGTLSYGSTGVGASPHLLTELFQVRTGTKLVHVPYQGSPQAVTDLLAGRIHFMFSPAAAVLPHIQAGTLKALASTPAKRPGTAPDLPTMIEAGVDLDASLWFAFWAPSGTPREVIDKLSRSRQRGDQDRRCTDHLQCPGFRRDRGHAGGVRRDAGERAGEVERRGRRRGLEKITQLSQVDAMKLTVQISLLAAMVLACLSPVALAQRGVEKWVVSWTASIQGPYPVGNPSAQPDQKFAFPSSAEGANDQTFRLVLRPDIWGRQARLRLSNVLGTRPVTFDGVHVGLQLGGPALVKGSNRPVSFGGKSMVTVAPGTSVWSDPVTLGVRDPGALELAGRKLAVSFHVVGNSGPMTWHAKALQTSYVSAPKSGSLGQSEDEAAFPFSTASWFFLDAVEMTAPADSFAIVAFGDSITDGTASTMNGDDRWPDVLSRRLRAVNGNRIAVVNAGIGGNQVAGPPSYNADKAVSRRAFVARRASIATCSISPASAT